MHEVCVKLCQSDHNRIRNQNSKLKRNLNVNDFWRNIQRYYHLSSKIPKIEIIEVAWYQLQPKFGFLNLLLWFFVDKKFVLPTCNKFEFVYIIRRKIPRIAHFLRKTKLTFY